MTNTKEIIIELNNVNSDPTSANYLPRRLDREYLKCAFIKKADEQPYLKPESITGGRTQLIFKKLDKVEFSENLFNRMVKLCNGEIIGYSLNIKLDANQAMLRLADEPITKQIVTYWVHDITAGKQ